MATASVTIDAPAERVWAVLTDPAAVQEFMFGTTVVTDWTPGSPIVWRGTWQGKEYEDKGTILDVEPGRRLVHTHFSPLGGEPDVPESYHTLTWTLAGGEPTAPTASTVLTLSQDNNPTDEAAAHARGMWEALVASVKDIAERDG